MLRPYLLALVLLFLSALPIAAQEAREHQRTAAPAEARFEIVQSSLAVRFTVRLDKYTGTTYLLIQKANGDVAWRLLKREDHPSDTGKVPGKVNYQIFTSGIMMASTFLINVNTGATWQFLTDAKSGDEFWKPVSP